jgi:hypothetical protein
MHCSNAGVHSLLGSRPYMCVEWGKLSR